MTSLKIQSFTKKTPVEKKSPIIITENATRRIKELLLGKGGQAVGIRIGVKQKGCFGFKYNIEYVYEVRLLEAVIDVEDSEFKVIIDPRAMMCVSGMTVDYVEEKLSSGFVFDNPNEKGRCGCGESFYV